MGRESTRQIHPGVTGARRWDTVSEQRAVVLKGLDFYSEGHSAVIGAFSSGATEPGASVTLGGSDIWKGGERQRKTHQRCR
ncbi:hypothetical protein MATL_G00193630 [Megalops atlanticus]|uniref:Uncharacterized protein n=1 Tax=Megalops atlanticus TaxID=7932 RepID=A0A9D3T5H0_MEGAT|nr:hypothetical protein MATL_G00193630 [Megalops atlanticus]